MQRERFWYVPIYLKKYIYLILLFRLEIPWKFNHNNMKFYVNMMICDKNKIKMIELKIFMKS